MGGRYVADRQARGCICRLARRVRDSNRNAKPTPTNRTSSIVTELPKAPKPSKSKYNVASVPVVTSDRSTETVIGAATRQDRRRPQHRGPWFRCRSRPVSRCEWGRHFDGFGCPANHQRNGSPLAININEYSASRSRVRRSEKTSG